MLGDFTVKIAKAGREIRILKIDQVETKYGVRQIIEIICVTCVQNIISDLKFIEALIDKT